MRLRYPHLLVALLLLTLLTALLSSAGFTPTQAQTLPAGAGSGAGHSSPQRAANVTAATFPATMSEKFESSWPSSGWTLSDLSSTDGGEYLWGRRNCNPHSGGYAGWSVGGGAQGSTLQTACANQPDLYPDNALTRAVYGPFDLSDVTSATVTYYIWGSTEWDGINRRDLCIYDSFTIEGYTDAGGVAHNQYCGDWTHGSDGNGYYKETLNLSPLLGPGQGNAWLKLEFSSDSNTGDIGMLVDDITLSVTHQPPTNTPTSTPTSTPTNTPIGTPTNTPTSTPTNTPTNTVGQLTARPVYLPIAIRALPPPPTPTPTPPPVACADVEPNDTPEQSQQLTTINRSCIGSFQSEQVGKDDYYGVQLNIGQHIIVDLTGIPSGANYDIALIRQDGPTLFLPVAVSANSGQANEHIDYVADSNKHYFVRVRATAKSTSANNAYILRVAIP
jgi:hypothetical protein